MMVDIIAALPGFDILFVTESTDGKKKWIEKEPIIGWHVEESGFTTPITYWRGICNVDHDYVVRYPSGQIVASGYRWYRDMEDYLSEVNLTPSGKPFETELGKINREKKRKG